MGKIKELAEKATVIIGGMAYFPDEENLTVINLHNPAYKAIYRRKDKLLLETNMSDKALKRIDGYNMTIEKYL